MPEIADAYRATRARVRALLDTAPPGATDHVVPACPEWTVHDVVAHLAGVSTDLVEGRLDGIASDEWTGAQVERARGRSVAALLDEWDANGAEVDTMADALPAAFNRPHGVAPGGGAAPPPQRLGRDRRDPRRTNACDRIASAR